MKQTCKQCRWCYIVPIPSDIDALKKPIHESACYWKGKWRKWLKKGTEDKPNDCINFEV